MGLIKAGLGALNSTLADQWKEYIYCDAMDADTLLAKGKARIGSRSSNTKRDENIITNGSKIAVNEGQFMMIVENGKVVDFSGEAGAFIYQSDTEPSLFEGGWKGLKESFKKVGKRFTYGGQPENDQRVYFVNTKEIMDNKVGIGDVPFRDSEFGFTMMIKGYGTYSYRITDPIMFYTNVCANVSDSFQRSAIDGQLKTEVQQSLQPALGKIALKGIPYDQLPLFTKEIADQVNEELTEDWVQLRGISLVSVALASITPDEESAKKIAQFQESRVYTNPAMMGARLGGAQATAMEKAAENDAGAMTGFFGMGMAQNTGGMKANELFQMAADQSAKAPSGKPEEGQEWVCSCGTKNPFQSKFCSQCGTKRPQPEKWICPNCSTENEGKFCTECGTKKPEAPAVKKCKNCGFELPADSDSKFCPECGTPFKQEP